MPMAANADAVPHNKVQMPTTRVDLAEAAEAVRAFNLRFGEMEKVAWCLSRASRDDLLENRPKVILPEPVWKVRSWMGLQGVETVDWLAILRTASRLHAATSREIVGLGANTGASSHWAAD